MKRPLPASAYIAGIVLAFSLTSFVSAFPQHEREIPPPQDADFGARFFDQLQRIFGRFRDADLKRVFQSARPIRCADLITDKGEWREVAFFNEDRKLGDWYRTSLEEVKNDLAVYIFKGACGGQRSSVQVTTKFPVEESIKAYEDGRIPFKNIGVNVNAAVTANFDSQSQAYTFDLPYLFRRSDNNGHSVYSLFPNRATDSYATDVTNRWRCKAVAAEDVTYQFLICQADLVPRGPSAGVRNESDSFGSAAYSILSDGKEASASVKLSFGDSAESKDQPVKSERVERPPEQPPAPGRTWRQAASSAKLSDLGQGEFRLRFNAAVWKGKIGQSQWIADGMVASPAGPSPRNKDYCAWSPRSAGEAARLLDGSKEDSSIYSIGFRKEVQSTSAAVEIQAESGAAVGVLQCFFAKSQSPSDITVSMWLSVVGQTVEFEVPAQ
jgi:hypothetical protein